MSLWDWVGLFGGTTNGEAGWDRFAKETQGSVAITLGDLLQGIMGGGRQVHVFGDDTRMVVDVEGLLQSIPALAPLLQSMPAGVLTGLSGNAVFTYGQNVGATYGPAVTIRRGAAVTVTCNTANPFTAQNTTGQIAGPLGAVQRPIDTAAAVAVVAMSALLILSTLAAEVLIYLTQKHPDLITDKYGPLGTAQFIKSVCWFVSSRCMAVVVWVERKAVVVRQASANLGANIVREENLGEDVEEENLDPAFKDLQNRLLDAQDVLQDQEGSEDEV